MKHENDELSLSKSSLSCSSAEITCKIRSLLPIDLKQRIEEIGSFLSECRDPMKLFTRFEIFEIF